MQQKDDKNSMIRGKPSHLYFRRTKPYLNLPSKLFIPRPKRFDLVAVENPKSEKNAASFARVDEPPLVTGFANYHMALKSALILIEPIYQRFLAHCKHQ